MGQFRAAFKKAKDAKPIVNFAKPIGLGRHLVAVKTFRGRESQKEKIVFIEAEVVIIESDTEQVGATRGWPWFINTPGFKGEYDAGRMQEFIQAVADGVGDDRDVLEMGDELADEENNPGYGILVEVEIVPVMDKNDSSKALLRKNGTPVHNDSWTAVPDQDEAVVLATQAKMKTLGEKAPKVVSEPAPVKTTTTSSDPNPTQKVGGIRRLLGQK